jgi:hypothetical protein
VAEIQGSRELGGSRGRSPKVGCFKSRAARLRKDLSHPSEEDRWRGSRDLATSEVREVRARSLDVRGHEAVKWRKAVNRPSKEDRWQRSRDLANSGVRRVRAQVLGIRSHEDARSEKVISVGSGSREDRWIRTGDRVSEPREKRPGNLATGITRLRVAKSLGEKSAS